MDKLLHSAFRKHVITFGKEVKMWWHLGTVSTTVCFKRRGEKFTTSPLGCESSTLYLKVSKKKHQLFKEKLQLCCLESWDVKLLFWGRSKCRISLGEPKSVKGKRRRRHKNIFGAWSQNSWQVLKNFTSNANKPEFQYGIWNELSHMHTNKVAVSTKNKLWWFHKAFESHREDQFVGMWTWVVYRWCLVLKEWV